MQNVKDNSKLVSETLFNNLRKYNTEDLIDTTSIKASNTRGYLFQQRNKKINDQISSGKIQNSTKSTKTNSPTGEPGATSLPPIGNSFM